MQHLEVQGRKAKGMNCCNRAGLHSMLIVLSPSTSFIDASSRA
jgi:hypothetical protein